MNFERSAAFAGLRRAREFRRQTSESEASSLRHFNASTLQRFNGSSLELHIEELVLHGFAPGDRYTIGDAIERELVRLLGEQGVPLSLRSESEADEIRGATFNAAHNAKPPAIGQQIAQAVYQGFGR